MKLAAINKGSHRGFHQIHTQGEYKGDKLQDSLENGNQMGYFCSLS